MKSLQRSMLLPYSAEDAFNVVADVESYALFLPGCVQAQVEDSIGDDWLRARISFKLKGLSDSFVTENRMRQAQRIDMQLVEGPFRHLSGHWEFRALSEQGCKVSLNLAVDFGNRLMDATLGPWIDRATGTIVDAFSQRMRACHGQR